MQKKSGSQNRWQKGSSRNRRVRHSSGRGYQGNRPRTRRGRGKKTLVDKSIYVSDNTNPAKTSDHIPNNTFQDFKLEEVLTKNISDIGYINPTKIQDEAIPEILRGKDVLAIAKTGSGKTGAFLIPAINKALKSSTEKVLIVTPTRELATQINNEFKKFAKDTGLKMVLVIGGANIRTQIHLLKSKPQFVVATPGRLMDLEERNQIDLRLFNNIVLDEVDQMLDMGFVNDIKKIIEKLAEYRQSVFLSATMSKREEVIANSLLKNPTKVESNKQIPLGNIKQDVVKVGSMGEKLPALLTLMEKKDFNKVLIFVGTRSYADKITKQLIAKGINTDSLHGGKTQNKRSRVLNKFRQDKIDVLVATDVAARGIDIPDISHVINYDEPASYNDYIHRIGRTGRAGKQGSALTFVVGR